ncbi:centrosomal protein of 63 kDa isoform X4 [Tympanuchus pallidicinctus]|uniref:centrosomal protein of 63 kDa isoform X4 n=1 Tax=Tympanuchus pallidicinctus TaxID=109042 RepID=UPI002287127B|nr:centrosomal protein of 63 kDa isoform X4 [Tympanuchus pallidicinctus]
MEALLAGMQRNGQGSGFLTSCEAELQELMKQIDIMVAHKKAEWEGQTQALEACLGVREQELSSARAALEEKHKEVGKLRQQLEDMETAKQDLVREYEQQLKKFQEELARLRRSYEKLQKKQLRDAREEANKRQGDDQFEMSRLSRKLEEFRQKSLDWEKQRLLYQQQVASLEAQRKALAEQSELIQQSQLASRKQILESMELASRSEIQHLTSKLERANDAVCANELEVERLNMRVDDLTENNRMILEDQQRVEEELRQSKKMLEVLQDEKMELRATLQSQEDFIDSSKLHQEQLQKELARVTETLHTKEILIRALEERLQEKQLSSPGLEHVLLQLDVAQEKEQQLQAEVTHLEDSLVSSNARCVQLSEELAESIKELQSMEEHRSESKAEIKKLKEQLSQAEQIHRGGSTSDLEQRLRMEIERAERKAVEHRVILVQLETLKLENRHLSEMLEKVELGVLEGKDATLRALSEDYVLELNKLKSENQQLKKDLSEAREKLDLTTQVCQSQPEGTAQWLQSEEHEPRDVQSRTTQESQHKQDEQTEKIHHKPDETTQHHQGWKIQPLPAEMGAVIPEAAELPTQISRKICVESPTPAPGAFHGTDSLVLVLDDGKDFPDGASKQSNHEQESVPLCPLPTSSVGSVAARYLEEEELRSQHILECLDAHIEELKKESEKIVRHFGHQE